MNGISMHPMFIPRGQSARTTPVTFVTAESWPGERERLDGRARAFADAAGFEPKPGRHLLLPAADGGLAGVLLALEAPGAAHKDLFAPGALSGVLPAGAYRFANAPTIRNSRRSPSRWAHIASRATANRTRKSYSSNCPATSMARTSPASSKACACRAISSTRRRTTWVRRSSRRPRALSRIATARMCARSSETTSSKRTSRSFTQSGAPPRRAPRLIDVTWGDPSHPKITLVGKGVCFDTGGLDIKPESGMLNMKKDMGGAACMLALAHMLMDRGTKIRLRVLIPAVENAISGSAFRPRDIYRVAQGPHRRDRQHRCRRPADPRRRASRWPTRRSRN